jgi:cis-3-alkyl-4-acyloxetan-2-one decarboxylase
MVIERGIYPFDGHRFDRGGGICMNYVDEGPRDAPPVVMVHGNPTWSIYYRGLVLALRDRFRCVVPDHVGMGLSDKPGDDRYEHTLRSRIDDLEKLLDSLEIRRDITLVVHDWGGAIGMGYATRHPERIARLVILNTAAFHMPRAKTFPAALALTRSRLGQTLVERSNAFARTASWVCTTKTRMPRALRKAYVAPYEGPGNSHATLRFVEDIPLRQGDRAWDEISRIEEGLTAFRNTPSLLFWGLRDFVFDETFLREWERQLPNAEVHRFPESGHYVLEDEGRIIEARVRDWLSR